MAQLIVLAGGLGTRLVPAIGAEPPKVLAPIDGVPCLVHILRLWELRQDISEATLLLGHKSEMIAESISGFEFAFPVRFVIQPRGLGTGGAYLDFLRSRETLGAHYLVNGDTLFDPTEITSFANDVYLDVVLASKPDDSGRYGAPLLDRSGSMMGFERNGDSQLVSMGVYLISEEASYHIDEHFSAWNGRAPMDFEEAVVAKFCSDTGKTPGFPSVRGTFLDIGIPEDYERAPSFLKALVRG